MKAEKILFLYHSLSYKQELTYSIKTYIDHGDYQELSQILTKAFGFMLATDRYDFADELKSYQKAITDFEKKLPNLKTQDERKKIFSQNNDVKKLLKMVIAPDYQLGIEKNIYTTDKLSYINISKTYSPFIYFYERSDWIFDTFSKKINFELEPLDFPFANIKKMNKNTVKDFLIEIKNMKKPDEKDFSPNEHKKSGDEYKVRLFKGAWGDKSNTEESYAKLEEINHCYQALKSIAENIEKNKNLNIAVEIFD